MRPVTELVCCCCTAACKGRQWWNRDTGYGLCPKCAEHISERESAEEMRSMYGDPGVHYFMPGQVITYCGKTVVVGDFIRNIESGWHGKIDAISFEDPDCPMLECHGISFWGLSDDLDDKQWHAASDVIRVDAANNGQPTNPIT